MSFIAYIDDNINGPIDLLHAKGTIISTESNLRYENSTLHTPRIEADTILSKSDRKFKENIKEISNSMETILQLQAFSYNYIHDTSKTVHNGYIAQDMEKLLPHLVYKDKTSGHLFVNYTEVIPHITECIKEINTRLENLERKMDA
jgi:hypothetical protein